MPSQPPITDEFTLDILEVAYQELSQRRSVRLDWHALMLQSDKAWACWRDAQIERWADGILERVPLGRLRKIAPNVMSCLFEINLPWEQPEDDRIEEWTAYGLATLRWLHREWNGQTKSLQATREQIAAWLDTRQQTMRQLVLL